MAPPLPDEAYRHPSRTVPPLADDMHRHPSHATRAQAESAGPPAPWWLLPWLCCAEALCSCPRYDCGRIERQRQALCSGSGSGSAAQMLLL